MTQTTRTSLLEKNLRARTGTSALEDEQRGRSRVAFPPKQAIRSRVLKALIAIAVILASPHAFAQVFHLGQGTTYGTAYGSLGRDGANVYETYRKLVSSGEYAGVVGTNVVGNNSQVDFSGHVLGCCGNVGFAFNGQMFYDASATGPFSNPTNLLYLKSMKEPDLDGLNGDPEGRSTFDLRVGFMEDPAAFVAAKGGDQGAQDLFEGNWGTNGVFMHFQTTALNGNNWSNESSGIEQVAATSALNGGNDASARTTQTDGFTRTLISSGGDPFPSGNGVDVGAGYEDAVELSWKMFEQTPGNVVLQVKLGNVLHTAPVNTTTPGNFNDDVGYAGGSFNWQTAKPVLFLGSADFNSLLDLPGLDLKYPQTMRIGIFHPADFNADGVSDISDFNIFNSYKFTTDSTYSHGDANQDGVTDISDFNIFNANKFTTASAPPENSPVQLSLSLLDRLPPLEGLSGDNQADFLYDPATGELTLDTDGESLISMVIPGLEALATFNPQVGTWTQMFFNSKEQWGDLSFTGFTSTPGEPFLLANYSPGLSAADFGPVEYGLQEGGAGSTKFTTVTVVPEPSACAILAIAGIGLLGKRRRALANRV